VVWMGVDEYPVYGWVWMGAWVHDMFGKA
jgi:hypothetical protein